MTKLMFSEKDPNEAVTYGVDFTNLLGSATISATTRYLTVYQGTDATSASVLSGASASSGAVVTQRLAYGVDGCVYRVVFQVLTSAGDTLLEATYLPVNSQ
jgi:choline dehydrogenase-like flavoprotein